MTKTLSINDIQSQLPGLLALAKDGDEIIIEENGEPLAKVSPLQKAGKRTKRTAGLGKNTIWISDDFDDEVPDDSTEKTSGNQRIFGLGTGKSWISEDFNSELPDEFWGFDKPL